MSSIDHSYPDRSRVVSEGVRHPWNNGSILLFGVALKRKGEQNTSTRKSPALKTGYFVHRCFGVGLSLFLRPEISLPTLFAQRIYRGLRIDVSRVRARTYCKCPAVHGDSDGINLRVDHAHAFAMHWDDVCIRSSKCDFSILRCTSNLKMIVSVRWCWCSCVLDRRTPQFCL